MKLNIMIAAKGNILEYNRLREELSYDEIIEGLALQRAYFW
jgi:hypothetical protein